MEKVKREGGEGGWRRVWAAGNMGEEQIELLRG